MTRCTGTIIEESLKDRAVLDELTSVSTKALKVTERFQTPWISQWMFHSVEIEPGKADETAELLSKSLEDEHDWYTDFNNQRQISLPQRTPRTQRKATSTRDMGTNQRIAETISAVIAGSGATRLQP